MAISHCYWHLVVKNGNFTLLLTSSSQEWQFHIATDIYWSRMAISHCSLTSSGQEWQFHIATDIYWSRMAISHCYWHLVVKNGNFTLLLIYLVVKNGNFTLLLTSSGQEWQFHIATDIYSSKIAISHCYWIKENFTLLLTSTCQEWQFHIATDI